MLTEGAMSDREWGHFPALRALLEGRPSSGRYEPWISTQETVFGALGRLFDVADVARHQKEILLDAVRDSASVWDQVETDLERLQGETRSNLGILDAHLDALRALREEVNAAGEEAALEDAKTRLREAEDRAIEIADRSASQLKCIEDAGLADDFRCLLAIARIGVQIAHQTREEGEIGSRRHLAATRRAVGERWENGNTHLSNCIEFLRQRPEEASGVDAASLGTWIFLSLASSGRDPRFPWVFSNPEHAVSIGSQVLEGLDCSAPMEAGPSPAREVSREEALEIAKAYLFSGESRVCGNGIRGVYSLEELKGSRLGLLEISYQLSRCWIAYVARPFTGMISSSDVILVHRETGAVVYAGSAQDEG